MTTRFKDFGTGGSVNTEPVSFKLHGEEFECHKNLQGSALLSMASAGDGADASTAAKTMYKFFETALTKESYAKFSVLLSDPEKIVTVETLAEIAGWLVEQYSGRPISGPEQSVNGQ
jgi:hypothetical protein